MSISVVISAYNEQDLLEDCLKSAKLVADEIIVVNNSSEDKTEEIAKKYAKVYTRPNDPVNLNKNKNFGFTKAAGEWIISLDADERITPELAKEIKSTLSDRRSTKNGYEIPRKNIIFGKWIQHSIWWPDYNLRLFRADKGRFAAKHVHEKLEVTGEVGQLKNPFIHYNYQTVSQFINKLNKTYTESETENFISSGKSINWFDAIRWPANDFTKTFFFEKGYKDGMHGLVLSMFQAFYSLVFFAKVWERKEEFRDMTPDNFFYEVLGEFQKAAKVIRYWIYETLIDQNPVKKIYYKARRKFK
ncbi:MAG: glycosyltransferase family 2 protein [Candidatus Curtissbacteria bacterium]|nr:glycosyltransferase family 2 protein [Candidatus Curtissbacteria bacterium]